VSDFAQLTVMMYIPTVLNYKGGKRPSGGNLAEARRVRLKLPVPLSEEVDTEDDPRQYAAFNACNA